MKKMYMSPVAEILEIQPTKLMAGSMIPGSLNGDGNIDLEDIILGGDAGDAAAPDMPECLTGNWLWTLLVLLMMTVCNTVSAQTVTTVEPAAPPADGKMHSMTLYFKDCNEVKYSLSDLDHVTYLPGIGMKVYLKSNPMSIDYLFSQMEKIEYEEDNNLNANWEVVGTTMWADYPEAWRLEYPQVSYKSLSPTKYGAETKSQIIVKRTTDYGITYSLEWDNAKIANRWTCYQLHEGNTKSDATRKDDFKADPEVAVSATLSDYNNSGFSRGHLCPSADRLCSTEQNKQTFFLTNMQPQYQSHNGGLWSRLETLVRDYATNDDYTAAHCDTMYIVKAATITDKVKINNSSVDGVDPTIRCGTNNKLLVPKFFYMALLHYNKENDSYHAIAFWTEHKDENQSVANLADYAISINELEKRTGLDFFCNLPDVIEEEVEAQQPDLTFWKKITKSK